VRACHFLILTTGQNGRSRGRFTHIIVSLARVASGVVKTAPRALRTTPVSSLLIDSFLIPFCRVLFAVQTSPARIIINTTRMPFRRS
jgi:hypothetical protein